MKKLYINCTIIGLSIIFSSVSGMEKKNHFTLIVQPIGGYLSLHKNQKSEGPRAIHFALVECKNKNDENDPVALQYFKYRKPSPILPLGLFTKENQSCIMTQGNNTIAFKSDRVYEENSFISYDKYWQKALNSY
jgi:hypothetical protein